jgi:hypothetical protein
VTIGDSKDYQNYVQIVRAHRDKFDVGDLVTCECHGGAIGLLLGTSWREEQSYPSIDISRVLWLTRGKYSNVIVGNIYYHTISKLKRVEKYIENPR